MNFNSGNALPDTRFSKMVVPALRVGFCGSSLCAKIMVAVPTRNTADIKTRGLEHWHLPEEFFHLDRDATATAGSRCADHHKMVDWSGAAIPC